MCSFFRDIVYFEELKLSKIGFSGIKRSRFYVPVWKCVSRKFRVGLQGFGSVYLFTLMVTSLAKTSLEYESAEWFKYLTTWNYMLCVAYFSTAFILNLKNGSTIKRRSEKVEPTVQLSSTNTTNQQPGPSSISDPSIPDEIIPHISEMISISQPLPLTREEKFYWLLFSMSQPIGLVIVAIYWGFLFTGFPDTILRTYIDIDQHAIAYGLLLLEYTLTDIPIRILHLIYPFFFAMSYLLFNVTYWATTGIVIYPILHWNENPKQAVLFVCAALLATTAMHAVIFVIDVGKRKLSNMQR